MKNITSIDQEELARFSRLAQDWWNVDGPLKTLHDINPCRLKFIEQYVYLGDVTVLDVGCGGGLLTEAIARKKLSLKRASAEKSIVGIDPNNELICVARSHAKEQDLDIDYRCSSIEAYPQDFFDVVTCMELLEHVEDPEQLICHCARLLNPHGYLFLSTLNRTLTSYVMAILGAEYLFDFLPRQTHDYMRFIKPSELAAMVRKAGFNVVNLQGIGYHPFKRSAWLQSSVTINYLLVCQKIDH